MIVSYANNHEDVLLCRAFSERTDGIYVDVGAGHPTYESITKNLYDQGWHGINIEPNRALYQELARERPRDVNLCAAAGPRESEIDFYQAASSESWGLSTCDMSVATRNTAQGWKYSKVTVPVLRLGDVIDRYLDRQVDLLKIDVEGYEEGVLQGLDLATNQPKVLMIEATLPMSTTLNYLEWDRHITASQAYKMVLFDGLNRIYVHRDEHELARRLSVPVNVFDSFVSHADVVTQQRLLTRIEQLEDSVAAKCQSRLTVVAPTKWHHLDNLSLLLEPYLASMTEDSPIEVVLPMASDMPQVMRDEYMGAVHSLLLRHGDRSLPRILRQDTNGFVEASGSRTVILTEQFLKTHGDKWLEQLGLVDLPGPSDFSGE